MANVSFEEPTYQSTTRRIEKKSSLLSSLMLSWGLAKDEQGAQRALFIIAVISFVAAFALVALDAYRVESNKATEGPMNIPGQF